jgi:hypothetical protein
MRDEEFRLAEIVGVARTASLEIIICVDPLYMLELGHNIGLTVAAPFALTYPVSMPLE